MNPNNKFDRNLKTQLKFKKRLKRVGLKQNNPKDYTCFKSTGTPCSCLVCSPKKYSRKKTSLEDDIDHAYIIGEEGVFFA